MTGPDDLDLVYWPVGSVLAGVPFADHLAIAAAGGFTSLAVSPRTFKTLVASGMTAETIRARAAEHGLRFTQLDGITTWVENWFPVANANDGTRFMQGLFDVGMEEALDIAQALGMTAVVAVGFFDENSIPADEIVAGFARLCDAARTRGLDVDLEFIPGWGIPELPLAWHIVHGANRPNAGICVDTWHLQIGSSDFERDIALLESIPGACLRSVQLVDADLAVRSRPFTLDAVTRMFPGEGELDITRVLSIIAGKGGLQAVGPEIVGGRLAGLSPTEIGQVAGRTTRAALSHLAAAH